MIISAMLLVVSYWSLIGNVPYLRALYNSHAADGPNIDTSAVRPGP